MRQFKTCVLKIEWARTWLCWVDEASCRLLIMLGDGPRRMVLGDEVFSQRIDPMLLQETDISNTIF